MMEMAKIRRALMLVGTPIINRLLPADVLGTWIINRLIRSGVPVDPTKTLLTVRDRTTGKPRTTSVEILEQPNGQRRLVVPQDQASSNWVRDLSAAGEGILTRGGRQQAVTAVKLPAREARPHPAVFALDRSVEQDAKVLGISETTAEWLKDNGHLKPDWTAEQVDENRKQIHDELYKHELSEAQDYLALSELSNFSDSRKLEYVKTKLESVRLDYAQTLLTYRMLADIRFKLLAFIPAISGTAIVLLSRDVRTLYSHPQRTLVISVLGFVVTLGLAIYDQRNSQIHDATIARAKFLEDLLAFPDRKGHRGHMNQREEAPRQLFRRVRMWHDRGLAWIYGAVLGAWWFPIWYALIVLCEELAFKLRSSPTPLYLSKPSFAGILAALTALIFIYEFGHLEGRPKEDKKAENAEGGAAGVSRYS